MLKKYVGEQSPVTVVIGGHDFGTVETGDQIVVPDDLAETISWPETNWADGAAKASTTNKSKTTNSEKSGE